MLTMSESEDRYAYLESIAEAIAAELVRRGIPARIAPYDWDVDPSARHLTLDERLGPWPDDPADIFPPLIEAQCADGNTVLWGPKDERDDIPDGAWYAEVHRAPAELDEEQTTLIVPPPIPGPFLSA